MTRAKVLLQSTFLTIFLFIPAYICAFVPVGPKAAPGSKTRFANQIQDWVQNNIINLPNDKWPLALVVLCGGILTALLLCSLLKSLNLFFKSFPITRKQQINREASDCQETEMVDDKSN